VPESKNRYQIATRFDNVNLQAALENCGEEVATDFSTEYRAGSDWLLRYSYSNTGETLNRKLHSEIRLGQYRVSGEYNFNTSQLTQDYSSSVLSISKENTQAKMKLSLEYADEFPSPAVYLEIEADDIF
jgi:hypothetical protein